MPGLDNALYFTLERCLEAAGVRFCMPGGRLEPMLSMLCRAEHQRPQGIGGMGMDALPRSASCSGNSPS